LAGRDCDARRHGAFWLHEAEIMSSTSALPRRALLVLGMHRSGTSALTRVLSLHGLVLPNLLMKVHPENPKGFWEAPEIARFNDRLLKRLGTGWDSPTPPDVESLTGPEREALELEALALLEKLLPDGGDFVLKDPRLCRLLGLWLPALTRFGAAPVGILAVRHPLEVAASLAARDDMARPLALRLWLSHLLAAEEATRGLPRQVVHYDDLVRNWRRATRQMRLALGLPAPDVAAIEAFLEAPLRHAQSYTDTLLRDPTVPAAIKRVYAELRRAPFESGLDPEPFDRARQDLSALEEAEAHREPPGSAPLAEPRPWPACSATQRAARQGAASMGKDTA